MDRSVQSRTLFSRASVGIAILVATAVLVGCGDTVEPGDGGGPEAVDGSIEVSEEQVLAVHQRLLTIDTHDDIPFDFATPAADPGVESQMQIDLPKMERGGLDVGFFIVYVGQTERTEANIAKAKADAMIKFDAIHRMTEQYPERIELAHSVADVERISAAGKLVAAIGIENGYVIGRDLGLLERYHELGARYITLAHGGHNDIADSSTPRFDLGDYEAEHDGVSDFGRQVIAEMNRLGIMVDVSHISKQAMLDAAELSEAPVIASHSSVTALAGVPRNVDDEQLDALAANGGVIQIVALDSFVKAVSPEKRRATSELRESMGIDGFAGVRALQGERRDEYEARMAEIDRQWPRATVSDFVDHIDYAVERIGIDHVGISSDFNGGGGVDGWDDASETPNVTAELMRRGYSEEQLAKLWGDNLLRVWRAVEEVSARLKSQS